MEFAIVCSVFLPLCLAIMQVGMLMWAEGTMQSTAAAVARCAAISSPLCAGTNGNTNFAATTWQQWIFSQVTSATTVQVQAGQCVGGYASTKATMTCTYWNWLINPFVNGGKTATLTTLTAIAYFPSTATAC